APPRPQRTLRGSQRPASEGQPGIRLGVVLPPDIVGGIVLAFVQQGRLDVHRNTAAHVFQKAAAVGAASQEIVLPRLAVVLDLKTLLRQTEAGVELPKRGDVRAPHGIRDDGIGPYPSPASTVLDLGLTAGPRVYPHDVVSRDERPVDLDFTNREGLLRIG